jgi:hypothetical protein
MKHLFILIFVLLLSSCANAPKDAAVVIDEAKTKEVFEHHFKAIADNDIEALAADYADDAVMVTATGTYSSAAEIKDRFKTFVFKIFPKDSTTFEMAKTVFKGDIAYVTWKCKSPKVEFSFATDTFIIQNGKIVRQTFAGVVVK